MKMFQRDDPWELKKNVSDPWDSPSYRKREKQLLSRMGMDSDCAFSIPKHHKRPPSQSQRRTSSYSGTRRIDINESIKNPGFVMCLIVLIFLAMLFIVSLLTSFMQVVEMAQYGYLIEGTHLWLGTYAPRFIALFLLILLFFYLTKKQARS